MVECRQDVKCYKVCLFYEARSSELFEDGIPRKYIELNGLV